MKNFPPHYPEEYIIWEVEFFWKKFKVNENVLIPRLETEVLVRYARQILKNENFTKIYDIGSGSGIIGISLADLCENINFVDISEKALEVAKHNFFANFPDKKANFIHSDLFANISDLKNSEKILIISNLPYIKNDDWKNMSEDTIFEPKLALFGGEKTGFELYEKLFNQIADLWISGIAVIEFGFDQRQIAENFFSENFPHWQVKFFADYAGIERFAEVGF